MTEPHRAIVLSLHPRQFSICRLPSDQPIPDWAACGQFFSITRTADELSIVAESAVAHGANSFDPGWRSLKAHGPFDLSQVGVLASLVSPLARQNVSVFAVSTFDTDYLFVRDRQLSAALQALREAGHKVLEHESNS